MTTSYRLYLVSDLTQRFEPAVDIDAPNDAVAMSIAEELRSGRAAELWKGSQVIKGWRNNAAGPC
jgi:hypothetical protein